MTVELYYYIFLVLVGLFFCVRQIKSERLFSLLSFMLLAIYSIITRYSGFDIDMNAYSGELESPILSVYYLKEPVYWITSRYLYKLTESPEITFIIYDLVSFILILKARKNMKLPQYFVFLYILFFPSVMGLNNVYRQYLAHSIFIYFTSLTMINAGFFKKSFFILLSMLTHNVSALFTPLFFMINKKKYISISSIFVSVCILLLLPFALSTKSESDTGTLNAEVYLVVIFFILIFYIASFRLRLNEMAAKFFYYFMYIIILCSASVLLMGSAQSKRVGMFALIISLIPMVIAIEHNYKQRTLVRTIIFTILISPTLLFSSSLEMLLTKST